MTQGGSQYIYFTVPDDQQLGTIEVGTMKHTTAENTVQINIYDATLANGTVYTLVTDKSQTLTIADYTVLYNGAPAATKGALAVNDGVLTFRPECHGGGVDRWRRRLKIQRPRQLERWRDSLRWQ